MARVMVLDPERFNTSSWSGGTTTELFIWPEDASYKERRFDFRISTAFVELESSVFTKLPGVRRFISPLSPDGFRLIINGNEKDISRGEVLAFSGGDNIVCYGSGRDLNLMLVNAEGYMRCIGPNESIELPESDFVFIYSVEETDVITSGPIRRGSAEAGACAPIRLPECSFARILGAGSIYTTGRVVLLTVDLSA